MDKRFLTGRVKAVDADARTLTAYASTNDLDRDGDVIEAKAWDFKSYDSNRVFLWAHQYNVPPIGKVTEIDIDDKGLKFKTQFAKTPFADEIWSLYQDGFLNAFSVGFIPHEWKEHDDGDDGENGNGRGHVFTRVELLEISAVPVPANPNAVVERGVPVIAFKSVQELAAPPEQEAEDNSPTDDHLPTETEDYLALLNAYQVGRLSIDATVLGLTRYCDLTDEEADGVVSTLPVLVPKAVIGHRKEPLADEGMAWDGAGARRRLQAWAGGDDWSPDKYQRGFVFIDGEPDLLGSYKGPHHDVVDGGLRTVWNGVRAAMGSLVFGARGGRIADEGDRRGVFNHLRAHYLEFDKEAPEFRAIEDYWQKAEAGETDLADLVTLAALVYGEPEQEVRAKAGRVLSAANEAKIRNAHNQLGEVLAAVAQDTPEEETETFEPRKDNLTDTDNDDLPDTFLDEIANFVNAIGGKLSER